MDDMQQIDKSLKQTKVRARKKFLIRQLERMGIYQTSDGRNLKDVSLYTLEWTSITEKNKASKAYADKR